jgi:hypothetical protein
MMVSFAGLLACHPGMAAMSSGCGPVSALRLRAVIGLRRLRLIVVIGVNFLLGLNQYGKRGTDPNCQHKS